MNQPSRSPFDALVSLLAGEPQPTVEPCGEVTHRHYLFEGPKGSDEEDDE